MPTEHAEIALIISVAGAVIAAVGAVLVYVQLRKNHEWNRRRASHDLLFGPYLDSFMPLYNQIRAKVNLFAMDKNFADYASSFSTEDLLVVDQSLNFLENVCVLMRDNAVDRDIIYKSMGSLIPNYFRFFGPYIENDRKNINPLLWIYLDEYADAWKTRAEDRLREGRSRMLARGKRRI